jgi:hypothetical protein
MTRVSIFDMPNIKPSMLGLAVARPSIMGGSMLMKPGSIVYNSRPSANGPLEG